jgi:hypothetical protein
MMDPNFCSLLKQAPRLSPRAARAAEAERGEIKVEVE